MRFSIIVPVYNVEKYLEECLQSILSQSFNDYELILVNDGSTDKSSIICENYKIKHSKIKYIYKNNGGLSSARNEGLLNSIGDYIIFTDSDDFWKGQDVLLKLNEIIINEKPDVILHEETRYYSTIDFFYDDNIKKIKTKSNDFKKNSLELIYNEVYVACAWDKIVKREILINNNLFFPLNRKSEDIEWCVKLLGFISKYSLFNYSFYYYRQSNTNSITKNIDYKHVLDVFQMIKNSLEGRKNRNDSEKKAIENFLTINYVTLLMNYYVIPISHRTKIKSEIFEWRFLIKSNVSYRVDKIYKIYRITNFNLFLIILNFYRIINNFFKNNNFFGKRLRINK
jgi:glycosyltransferase involved in cell wall biosynthesis